MATTGENRNRSDANTKIILRNISKLKFPNKRSKLKGHPGNKLAVVPPPQSRRERRLGRYPPGSKIGLTLEVIQLQKPGNQVN
jgi:hypothetical protein